MFRKLITFMLLSLSIFIVGCSNQLSKSTQMTLEQSIKEIIISKDSGYNFLDDEGYINHMTKFGHKLVKNKDADPAHYAIGNLDKDNIPELVVFNERDSEDTEDEGSLEVYKFNGDKYTLLDSISMNFDNTNYQIEIGKISETQNGMFINNQVGSHSGITYGFIIEDKELKSILNGTKIPLLSVYTDNKIKDINQDGILNFSISTVDPETEESELSDSDKMTLWYKWNKKDSGDLLKIERKNQNREISNKELFNEINETIDNNFSESIKTIKNSDENLSNFDKTKLLIQYIRKLDKSIENKSTEVDNLFVHYQKDDNFNYIFTKYGLTLEKINNIEYLNREKVLKDEKELKENILNNIDLGYKLDTSNETYHYEVNYQFFLDTFEEDMTNEYKDLLNILALNTNQPYMKDGELTVSMEDLSERILQVEAFKIIYPYSDFIPEIEIIYREYLNSYFYGDLVNPNFHKDTLIVKDSTIRKYEESMDKYEYTVFSNIIKDFMDLLEKNNNRMDDKFKEQFDGKLN